ncbi:efflux RND transporter periplasmic adaptor subunit [Steroidobacter sp. S1-65]|uniref:Efflux RND transporter periplasmic adaptor subunit n=1 Tax=Steroidobacter gossypii TaxID=2805490 RepID=A0ABS1WRR8_9GAMM|nr:efflux RND transporter periplasmic adaptor subunit [Steroidobacter gossypii]MBM0103652.1 efflux RND transporter periplasmic adaptor subunit [Steroidobacter gossypii]
MKTSANQPSARYEADRTDPPAHAAAVTPFPTRPTEHRQSAPVQEAAPEMVQQEHGDSSKITPMKAGIIVAALAIIGAIAWFAMRDPAAAPAAAVGTPAASAAPVELAAVDVSSVESRVLSRALPLSGSIAPYVQATLKSKVGGEVEQLRLREGQDVREGEVIARVDTRNLQAQYDREAAAVEKARADLELARLNRDKNRALLDQKFISQNTFEQTESAYAASIASFKLAEAQARVAKINLDDAVIRAPFSGTVARRLVQPGEKVSPDSEIVTLVDLKQMVLEAAVPSAEIPSVSVGQKVRFRVAGFGERTFEGEVQRINPMTSDGSRAIMIYIAVPNPDSALKGGMFAQGELMLNATEPVLAVAQRAVRDEAGVTYVYVLRDEKIVRTPVTLGPRNKGDAFVEVREGLSPGDQVIVAEIGDDKAGAVARVRKSEPTAAVASEVARN